MNKCMTGLFVVTVAVFALPISVHAHGLIGKCFLPATLATDDPFVADELSLPTVSHIRRPASGDVPATKETEIGGEVSKRLSPNLGLTIDGVYRILDQERDATLKGFDNLGVRLKYVFFRNPEHQTLLAAGVGWDVGGTGSAEVGAESFHTVTPQLFWGKCFGDLPDSLSFLQPFVVTGLFGVGVPSRRTNTTVNVNPDTGEVTVQRDINPNVAKWGFSIQYDLYYLQNFVRDVGLPAPFNRMIPLVEFAMQTPLNGASAGKTTGTINPGLIWFGRKIQLGVEAQIPVNGLTGKNVGILAQVHFFLDDIAPEIFTWTPFHGVLGPTFPR